MTAIGIFAASHNITGLSAGFHLISGMNATMHSPQSVLILLNDLFVYDIIFSYNSSMEVDSDIRLQRSILPLYRVVYRSEGMNMIVDKGIA